MQLKALVYKEIRRQIEEKAAQLQEQLAALRYSVSNETKSTAGDKHETARAHLHIEQENTGRQLQEVLHQKSVLDRIDPAINTSGITLGSLIKTSKGYFFMSIAAGRLHVENQLVIALSPHSPLGLQLTGRRAGDRVVQGASEYLIESIC